MQQRHPIGDMIQHSESEILTDWTKAQLESDRTPLSRIHELCENFLWLFLRALQTDQHPDRQGSQSNELRNLMSSLRRERTETVSVISLYQVIWTASDVINRQQEEMMELSTPVVPLWEGILALPVIGILNRARAQTLMESLLTAIMETGSKIAIVDITGVPTVDSAVAQHLMKTVAAARLMGADCPSFAVSQSLEGTCSHGTDTHIEDGQYPSGIHPS